MWELENNYINANGYYKPFFFSDFLEDFRTGRRYEYSRQFVDRVSAYEEQTVERMLMRDIANIPVAFQGLTVPSQL